MSAPETSSLAAALTTTSTHRRLRLWRRRWRRCAPLGWLPRGELLSAIEHEIATVIVQRAKELDVQLIVLGDTLHRGPSKLFRASVTDQIIHQHPPCSVLLVH